MAGRRRIGAGLSGLVGGLRVQPQPECFEPSLVNCGEEDQPRHQSPDNQSPDDQQPGGEPSLVNCGEQDQPFDDELAHHLRRQLHRAVR